MFPVKDWRYILFKCIAVTQSESGLYIQVRSGSRKYCDFIVEESNSNFKS